MMQMFHAPTKMGCSLVTKGASVNANIRSSTSLTSVLWINNKRNFSVGTTGQKNNYSTQVHQDSTKSIGGHDKRVDWSNIVNSNTESSKSIPKNFIREEQEHSFAAVVSHIPMPPPKTPCRLRYDICTPGSNDTNLPEFVPNPSETFPYCLAVNNTAKKNMSIEEFAKFAKEYYAKYLQEKKCIIFKNTPIKNHNDYNNFMEALGYRTHCYKDYVKFMNARSMSSTQVNAAVRTASDEPGDYTIEPHCEYHTAGLPSKISLFCDQPSTVSGESLFSDNRAVLNDLKNNHIGIFNKLNKYGIEYEVYYKSKEHSNYNNWEVNINSDKKIVEDYLEAEEYTWVWEDEYDGLRYKKVIPLTKEHWSGNNEICYFNQLVAHHWTFYMGHPKFRHVMYNSDNKLVGTFEDGLKYKYWPVTTRYGNGEEIEESVLKTLREVVWKHTIACDLDHGDVVMCDNYLAKHGRMPYPADDKTRKVYVSVSFCNNENNEDEDF